MTKNGFRILVEQDLDGSIDGALAELVYRGELPEEIKSAETMRQRVPVLLDNGEYELLSAIATALMADTLFYRQNESHSDIIPVRTMNDVLDLFEEDKTEEPEMTLEKVQEWIQNNDIDPGDLYEEETLTDWIKDHTCIDDLYDCDEIMDWVHDNLDPNDVTSLEWRY